MSAYGWPEIAGMIGVFGLFSAVITMSIWQFAAPWRASAS